MSVHKHLIRQWIEAHPDDDYIRVTLDAIIDLGAQSLVHPDTLATHVYGTLPSMKPAPTTLVLAADLLPFLAKEEPEPMKEEPVEKEPVAKKSKAKPKKAEEAA